MSQTSSQRHSGHRAMLIIIIINNNKEAKYRQLANSHIFVPVAIETAGTWNNQAVELV